MTIGNKLKSILITGGARSGKSRFALEFARKTGGPVLFIATAVAGDREMQERIKKHRKERPPDWRVLEATSDIGSRIEQAIDDARVVIIDCITMLINSIFSQYGDQEFKEIDASLLEQKVVVEITGIIERMKEPDAMFIIVTNEVGLGLVPDNRMGRLYRDVLGRANQMLAGCVDEVYLMVAGIPVQIKPS
jgi:adenosylcobinamide kinase/adenosylcobinamide-phosphate guanylyltransferase